MWNGKVRSIYNKPVPKRVIQQPQYVVQQQIIEPPPEEIIIEQPKVIHPAQYQQRQRDESNYTMDRTLIRPNDRPQYQNDRQLVIKDDTFSAPFSLMDINNRVNKYQESEEEMIQKFEEQQRQEREKFTEQLRQRKKMFENEISAFENSMNDPYKILGIKKDANLQEIKSAYKHLARKNHPDKGGDADKFKMITQSYCYLVNKFEKQMDTEKKTSRPVVKRDYNAEMEDNRGMQSVYVDKDKFDVKKFNQIFDQIKVEDVFDEGYGDLMTKEEIPQISGSRKGTVFSEKFNKDMFNRMFEDENTNDELIEYGEPEALPSSSNMGYKELGQTKITDFSKSDANDGSKFQYTDYKRAYEKNKFNPNQVKYKEYKNIDELKRDRGNVSHEMTEETRRSLRRKEEQAEERERRRLEKLQHDDEAWKVQYDKLNRLFIKQ